jgi:hypothetical protein
MSGQAFRAEGVTVAVGQTVWIVMAYAPQTEDIGTLVRIITSVALSDAAVR